MSRSPLLARARHATGRRQTGRPDQHDGSRRPDRVSAAGRHLIGRYAKRGAPRYTTNQVSGRDAAVVRLERCYVADEHRRQGVGRSLVAYVVAGAVTQKELPLEAFCRETDDANRAFLTACGMRGHSLRRDWYHEPTEDAYVLRKAPPVGCRGV